MKGIVIYDSSYGNTKKIATAIADTLNESKLHVDLFYMKDIKELEKHDFLVIGSPTKIGTMSWTVRRFIGKKINDEEWANKPFATFDTEMASAIKKGGASAAEKIAEKLKGKNLRQALPPFKAVVRGMKGPLEEGEIEKAEAFAKELARKLQSKK